jgi:hypothetical protein
VAPSGNQTATENTNINLKCSENSVYSPNQLGVAVVDAAGVTERLKTGIGIQ